MAAALALSAGAAVFAASPAPRMSPDTEAYRSDFQAFCRQVEENYAYFDARETDWASACAAFGERAAAATSRDEFIAVLEAALRQLYDTHAHLATNTPRSPRLVPSGVDVMARWIDGKAVVTDVWPGSGAARSGLRAGDEILMLDGVPVADAAAAFTPIHLRTPDVRARNFGLQVALAGRHEVPRVALRVRSGDATRDVAYAAGRARSGRHLDVSLRDGVAVVRIDNALGEESLIGDFDRALDTIGSAGALVLDLRDTPSGGTSTVARGILGRFVKMSSPYQRHELVSEFRRTGVKRHWVEYVAPRPPVLDIPVVVLVGPWTGSMGEGLAIARAGGVTYPDWSNANDLVDYKTTTNYPKLGRWGNETNAKQGTFQVVDLGAVYSLNGVGYNIDWNRDFKNSLTFRVEVSTDNKTWRLASEVVHPYSATSGSNKLDINVEIESMDARYVQYWEPPDREWNGWGTFHQLRAYSPKK